MSSSSARTTPSVLPELQTERAERERVLQSLRELSDPALDVSGIVPYTEIQTSVDPFYL